MFNSWSGSKIPHASLPKNRTWNRSNIVTNSIKTLSVYSFLKMFQILYHEYVLSSLKKKKSSEILGKNKLRSLLLWPNIFMEHLRWALMATFFCLGVWGPAGTPKAIQLGDLHSQGQEGPRETSHSPVNYKSHYSLSFIISLIMTF